MKRGLNAVGKPVSIHISLHCPHRLIRAKTFLLSFNPFPNDILDSSKLKEFTDKNFDSVENGKKFSKRVENTMEKEKLLVISNSPFPTVFSEDLYSRRQF